MSPSKPKMIPDNYNAADLGEMPDFADITPEMIDFYVRKGKEMRSVMLFDMVSGAWRRLRRSVSGLAHRFGAPGGRLHPHH